MTLAESVQIPRGIADAVADDDDADDDDMVLISFIMGYLNA